MKIRSMPELVRERDRLFAEYPEALGCGDPEQTRKLRADPATAACAAFAKLPLDRFLTALARRYVESRAEQLA